MYDVAMSVLSCLRAGTEVHVAWVIAPDAARPGAAMAVTPGGGRMGDILDGAIDHTLREAARKLGDGARLLEIQLGPAEAMISGLPTDSTVTVGLMSGETVPAGIWEDFAAHRPTGFSLRVDGEDLTQPERMQLDSPGVEIAEGLLMTSYVPVTRVVIAGGGPFASAIADAFGFIGWQPLVHGDVGAASGVMATLSAIDAVVVLGHEVEPSGRALQAAISSNAGYIASVGSQRMQELRREWLAYRNVEWDDRIHGPAGLDIGASSPPEVAVSIVAQAISARHDT